MSNGERNINDGNNNQYTLSRPVAGPQTCASGISWFEDERSSSSSNVSSPTTVIRHNSSDNPYQHNLRCHSQSLPIRKASVKSWKSLEAEAPGRLIPSENDRHVDNIQNLAQYHQDETTFSGQQDIMQQDNESSMLSDMVSEAQTWISEDSENKTKSSKNSDNTPYIRFAIEQLTRAEDLQIESLQLSYLDPVSNFRPMKPSFPESNQANTSPTRERINLSPSSSPETYLDYKIISNQGHPYLTPEREREGMALTRKYRSPPSPGPSLSLYPTSHLESIRYRSQPESFSILMRKQIITLLPSDTPSSKTKKNPPLTFVPWILRLPSMLILSLLCLVMISLLLFLAILFLKHNKILVWHGSVSGRQYFLIKFCPQLYAAFIFVYIQCVISAIIRIMPFCTLASDCNTLSRSNAIFSRLYPNLLTPARVGDFRTDICLSIFWSSVFTIPLQSCLFSVKLVGFIRYWVIVQGVVWCLVIIYIAIIFAAMYFGYLFFHRTTGLVWDPRSLADIISLLPRSNGFHGFSGCDILKTKKSIQCKIGTRRWRLGYWKMQNNPSDDFYCLGQEEEEEEENGKSQILPTDERGSRARKRLSDLVQAELLDIERGARWHDRGTRYRFISWYLRKTFIILWPVLGVTLWLILIVVFFLPKSTLLRGFIQSESILVKKNRSSTVQFIISFGPSSFGMLLYLLFQSIDMRLRILKPWAELSKSNGSTADNSLLLDYPAALPIHVSLSAFSAAHYRISIVSLLTTIFILLPIFSGNLFYPRTTSLSGEIEIVANLSAIIFLIVLLSLYIFGLSLFIFNPDIIYLPHDVSCLAEVMSFLYNSHILEDAAFLDTKSKVSLVTRLMAEKTSIGTIRGDVNRWAFGVYKGIDGKDSMGIERVGRNPGVGLMIMSAR